MLTNRGRLAQILRDVDWIALSYPEGLDAVQERLDRHTGRNMPPATCSAITNHGARCQRGAGADGLCGTHRKYRRAA